MAKFQEFTNSLDIDLVPFNAPSSFKLVYSEIPLPPSYRDVVLNAFVFIHQTLSHANAKLVKTRGIKNVLTPRHFLDFIQHYVRLFNEKREDLEDQQRHLNVGLEKLNETVQKVEDLRKSLAVKKVELENKSNEANEKLKRMVADQQEAEKKKAASLEIQSALEKQNIEIESRRKIGIELE